MKEITVSELSSMRNNEEDFQLIDVRESYEADICSIGGELIPMIELMGSMDKIRKDVKVVIHCRSGKRSAAVVHALEKNGFDNIYSLKGGIMAWADEVDTSLEKY